MNKVELVSEEHGKKNTHKYDNFLLFDIKTYQKKSGVCWILQKIKFKQER